MRASRRRWQQALQIVVFCSPCTTIAMAQSRTAQVMILPDPTPREPDLEKRFKTSAPPSPGKDPARVTAFNQQRLQLIGRASTHLRSLAALLQRSVAQHPSGASLAPEAQVAGAIETLAGNVYTAMATPGSSGSSGTSGKASVNAAAAYSQPAEVPDLTAATRHLAELTEALETEVSKSSVDTLSVGVLVKSAQVRDLAHTLKTRMEQP